MPRIAFSDLKAEFKRVLVAKGARDDIAEISARLIAESSCDGVCSHGVNRFPRVVEYIDKGDIDVNATPTRVEGIGGFERWDGHLGLGNVNAKGIAGESFLASAVDEVLADIKASVRVDPGQEIYYPGEKELNTRAENLAMGIPVDDGVWAKIRAL